MGEAVKQRSKTRGDPCCTGYYRKMSHGGEVFLNKLKKITYLLNGLPLCTYICPGVHQLKFNANNTSTENHVTFKNETFSNVKLNDMVQNLRVFSGGI